MKKIELSIVESMIVLNGSVCALLFIDPPENCRECPLHILTFENERFEKDIFSCAGFKGRGTINSESDFLNNFDDYSKSAAPNCPLKVIVRNADKEGEECKKCVNCRHSEILLKSGSLYCHVLKGIVDETVCASWAK